MQVSEEAKRAAQNSVRGIGTEFGTTSKLADLAVSNAPIAAPAIEAFHSKWSDAVTAHLEILDAAAVAVTIVADSLIETDAETATTLIPTGAS